MKLVVFFLVMAISINAGAQMAQTLPDYTFKYVGAKKYSWRKVYENRDRILLHNSLIVWNGVTYSFGGYDDSVLSRELNIFKNGRFVKDQNFVYPGKGFMNNIFFQSDSCFFIGGGRDSAASLYAERDFWKYDLKNKAWTKLAELPFIYRTRIRIFDVNGEEIIAVDRLNGGQYYATSLSLYKYNSSLDRWLNLKVNCPEDNSGHPEMFVIGNELFVFFQHKNWQDFHWKNSFWKYNFTDTVWKKLAPIPGLPRYFVFAMSDGQYGFIGGGMTQSAAYTRNVFRYDLRQDHWEKIRDLPRYVRFAVGWQMGSENFVGFGINERIGDLVIWKLTND